MTALVTTRKPWLHMETTTLTIKVSRKLARAYRAFCESHALQIGKFTEQSLSELMGDYHFGLKAQRALSRTLARPLPVRRRSRSAFAAHDDQVARSRGRTHG